MTQRFVLRRFKPYPIYAALFTGGGASFQNKNFSLTHYATTAQLVFNTSVAAAAKGETWPVWYVSTGLLLVYFANQHWYRRVAGAPALVRLLRSWLSVVQPLIYELQVCNCCPYWLRPIGPTHRCCLDLTLRTSLCR